MLRVYGINGGLVLCRRAHHYGPCRHKGFLVCKGYGLGGLYCRQSGPKAAETNHGSHHNIHRRVPDKFAGGIYAKPDIGPGKGVTHLGEFCGIADNHMRHPEGAGLLNEKVCVVVGRYHENGEPVRVLTHHIKGLRADRPRGTQYCD